MKKTFCLLVLCIASLCVVAQEAKELKQVKLKSGISISGYVTNNTDGSISITTVDGDELWYRSDEIQSVSEDPAIVEARRKAEAKAKEEEEQRLAREKEEAKAAKRAVKDAIKMKDKGFQLMAELGYGFYSPHYGGDSWDPLWWITDFSRCIDLSLTPCYRFNPHMLIGVGIGYKMTGWKSSDYYYDDVSGAGISFNAKLLYNFSSKRCTPYISMDGGYSLMTMHIQGRHDDHTETASNLDVYFAEFDLGYMFINRNGSGFNLALTVFYSPAPKGLYGIGIDNASRPGVKIGWTF